MRTWLGLLILMTAVLQDAGLAQAQVWPARPMTMVVGFPAGGSDDILARVLAPRLSELLHQQVTVENVSGGGGTTGALRVARANPDGYQFMLGTSATHALSQVLRKDPPYNALTDFAPVALIAEQPFVLIARKGTPAGLREFAAYAKAHQADMQYGSAGVGSATHLVCERLNAALGIKVRHAPYDGGAAALRDLVAGRIDYFCPVVTIAIPEIEKEAVRAVAILSKDRTPVLPRVASAHEQGLTDFGANTWFAVFLPKATPAAIVQPLHDAIVAAMETPSVQARLNEIGATVVAPERRSQDYLHRFVESEIRKWAAAIAAAGIKVD